MGSSMSIFCCKEVYDLQNCKLEDCTQQMCIDAVKSAVDYMNKTKFYRVYPGYELTPFRKSMSLRELYDIIPYKFRTDEMYFQMLLWCDIDMIWLKYCINRMRKINKFIANLYVTHSSRIMSDLKKIPLMILTNIDRKTIDNEPEFIKKLTNRITE